MSDFVIENGVLTKYTGPGGDVVIPDGVTSIGADAFFLCESLTSATIPDGLTSIGQFAFSGCSNLTSVTIPEGVTNIGERAFCMCSSLTSVKIPNSVTDIGVGAFRDCSGLQDEQGLVIVRGILYDCVNKDVTDVMIPEEVTSIGERAFEGCQNLTSIILPKSLTSIGEGTFYKCTNLTKMELPLAALQVNLFCGRRSGESVKHASIASVWMPDGKLKRVIAAFRSGGNAKKQIFKKPCLTPLVWEDIPHYDRLVASGSYDGFSLNQTERMQAALWRLGDTEFPVAGDARSDMIKLMESKVSKIIPLADEDNAPSYIQTLIDVGAINEGNVAKVKKQISACSSTEVKAMADKLNPAQAAKVTNAPKSESAAERLTKEQLKAEGLTEKQLADKLKSYYAVTLSQLPTVVCKDGSQVASYVLAWLLMAHETVNEAPRTYYWESPQPPADIVAAYPAPGIRPEAAEIVAELDQKSLQNTLLKLADQYLGIVGRSKKMYLAYPICRYADETLMAELCARAPKWRSSTNGINSPSLWTFRLANAYSDTRAAILFAEKFGDLDAYAKIRGTDAETLRDTVLADFGLDEDGKKVYDLGDRTVTASVGLNLSVELYDNAAGKVVKSLPKKDADPDKLAAAAADLTVLKKNVKKVVKARSNQLFGDFLSGKVAKAENWRRAYLTNPVLRRVAERLVWSQGNATFTLGPDGPIDSAGLPYEIADGDIHVAHPMKIRADDLRRWQTYFVSHALKQPFEQVWEPVIDPKTVRPDRYEGMEVSVFSFMHREKHGISFYDEDFHNEIGFYLEGCDLDYERTDWHRHEIAKDETFTLGTFSFKKYTRQVNHIVALLDRWTVAGRILKDDVSVRRFLDNFTAAQIMEFIGVATQNNCPNCTAMLLEYKQEHYPDLDPMAEFTLE